MLVATEQGAARRSTLRSLIALTKPRIIELLLVTTVPTMILAEGGWPSTLLVAVTVAGGTLAAAGANVLNMVCDRDIDQLMGRTSGRPLPASEISPRLALVFGVALGMVGFVLLATTVNSLAAALAVGSLLFYVFVYTIWLKRRTSQNIVIGGIAGATPVLIGWAAVTGSISVDAFLLFLVVVLWTPAHFWALAIRYVDDYRNAGVPMMPVVVGVEATLIQIRYYAAATAVATVLVVLGSSVGVMYFVPAAALGSWFLLRAVRLIEANVMIFFRDSIVFLTVLFGAVAVEGFLG